MGRRLVTPGLECRLRSLRTAAVLSQEQLVQKAGLTRQAISAVESGQYVPNTAVALRLAQVLGCRVEDLFELPSLEHRQAVQVVGPPTTDVRRLAVAQVRGRWVGYPLGDGSALHEGFLSADGLFAGSALSDTTQLLAPPERLEQTAVLLGCDPSLGILSAHVARRSAAARLLWLSTASQPALDAVAAGEAHIAGTHFPGRQPADGNLPQARQALANRGGLVVAFARWEQGLVVAHGNPKGIRSVADLVRAGTRVVNREAGAGSRALLDSLLAKAGIPAGAISGYDRIVSSHGAVAQAVASGGADAGIALRATARALGLDFLPLAEVHFDFVIPRDHVEHPTVTVMLDILQSRALRAELQTLAGYNVDSLGAVVADIPA